MAETLEEFANRNTGALEGFLGAIYYPDRPSAQRALDCVTQMTRASFNGRLPESFKGEIFEYADGTFEFASQSPGRAGSREHSESAQCCS